VAEQAGQECSTSDRRPDYPRYVVPLEHRHRPYFLGVVGIGVSELDQEGVNW